MIPWIRQSASGLWSSTCLVCGAQMGKTEAQLDLIGERLDTRPAPIIYVGPSKEFNSDQFAPRFDELLAQAPSLGAKVTRGKRAKATLRWIAGVRVRLAHAGSSTALKSDPAALALVDEYDEMLRNVKGQGDPLGLVQARGDTHSDFTTVVASTPSKGIVDCEMDKASGLEFWKEVPAEDLESAIWRQFQAGTMHHWAWPCPHCDAYFVPRSKLLHYPEGASAARAKREAYLQCPNCDEPIVDVDGTTKAAMNARGLFVARGQWIEDGVVVGEPDDRQAWSAWVSGLASPFVTWGERAARLVEAEASGDPSKIQVVTNAGFGELYAPGGAEVPEWKEVLDRRKEYRAGPDYLPTGALVIVAGADVQKLRILYTIRAFGHRATSWLLKSGVIYGDTTQQETWDALQDVFDSRYGGVPIKIGFVDSGFRPGKKFQFPENMVYEFCRRNRRFVFPTKGKDKQLTPIKRSKIEVNPKGGANKYGLELVWLDTDYFKSWVHERIRWPDDIPGAWNLDADANEDYARQIVSEARTIGPSGKPVWVARSRENHYLDTEAMCAAAGYMLNVQHIGPPTTRKAPVAETTGEPPPRPEVTAEVAASANRDKFAKMAARMKARRS